MMIMRTYLYCTIFSFLDFCTAWWRESAFSRIESRAVITTILLPKFLWGFTDEHTIYLSIHSWRLTCQVKIYLTTHWTDTIAITCIGIGRAPEWIFFREILILIHNKNFWKYKFLAKNLSTVLKFMGVTWLL